MERQTGKVEVPVHARVWCSDGPAGVSEALIVNAADGTVTAFVVRERHDRMARRLVPTELIESTTEEEIHLRCTIAELHQLDAFVETETMPPTFEERFEALPGAVGLAYLGPERFSIQPALISHERIPEGSVKIDRHAEVDASDGHVGRVEGFLIDDRDRVSHVVVRSRGVPRREFAVPASAVAGVDDERVRLHLDKDEVHALPHVRYHDLADLPLRSSGGSSGRLPLR
jgi:hypothetical protein